MSAEDTGEISALRTRAHETKPLDLTFALSSVVTLGEPGEDHRLFGQLHVEYKPRGAILDELSLTEYTGELTESDDPEGIVERLYRQLVAELFPGEVSYDKPWRHVPMVVSLEYGFRPNGRHCSVSLGRMY